MSALPSAPPKPRPRARKERYSFSVRAGDLRKLLTRLRPSSDVQVMSHHNGLLLARNGEEVSGFATDGIHSALGTIACRDDSPGEARSFVLSLNLLSNLIGGFGEDSELTFTASADKLVLSHPGARITLHQMDQSREFLESQARSMQGLSEGEFGVPFAPLRDALRSISFLTTSKQRMPTMGICLETVGDQMIMQATDRVLLGRATFPVSGSLPRTHLSFDSVPVLLALGGEQELKLRSEGRHMIANSPGICCKFGQLGSEYPNLDSVWKKIPGTLFETRASEFLAPLQRFQSQGIEILHLTSEEVGDGRVELNIKGAGDLSSSEEVVTVRMHGRPAPLDFRVGCSYLGSALQAVKGYDVRFAAEATTLFVLASNDSGATFSYVVGSTR